MSKMIDTSHPDVELPIATSAAEVYPPRLLKSAPAHYTPAAKKAG
jgi:hypothetical protein